MDIKSFIPKLLLLIIVFFLFQKKIDDPDLFWHIKTGEYIINNGLLKSDPFNFTSSTISKEREKFILNQYWLAQIILYLIYKFAGFNGIILLRSFIFSIIILVIILKLEKDRINPYISYPLILPLIFIGLHFRGDRPQIFSFLFTAILLYLLEDCERESKTIKKFLLPLLMFIWSNMHGGFILGDLMIMLYTLTRWKKENLIMAFISIMASFINPNIYKVIPILIDLQSGIFVKVIAEYISPIKIISYIPSYFILLFVSLLFIIININKINRFHLILLISFSIISLYSLRYTIFFGLIATPIIGKYINMNLGAKLRRKTMIDLSILIILSVFLIISLTSYERGIREDLFPIGAANFIKKNRINGNIFTPDDWGGYLTFKLYPQNRLFFDTRGLNEEIFIQYNKIIGGSNLKFMGIPEWKALLLAYDVNIIVTYAIDRYRKIIFPLINNLIGDNDWKLIYMDFNSFIFIRRDKYNISVNIPKDRIYDEIILEALQGLKNFPDESRYYVIIGDAYTKKGMYENALNAYNKALR